MRIKGLPLLATLVLCLASSALGATITLTVGPRIVTFPGKTVMSTFTLTNTASDTLHAFVGMPWTDYNFLVLDSEVFVPPHQSMSVRYSFSSDEYGEFADTVVAVDANDSSLTNVAVAALNALVEQRMKPEFSATGSFKFLLTGQTGCEHFTIRNPYEAHSISVRKIQVYFPSMGFHIDSSGFHLPDTVAAGDSLSFDVCVSDSISQHSYDTLVVSYADDDGTRSYVQKALNAFVDDSLPQVVASLPLTLDTTVTTLIGSSSGPSTQLVQIVNGGTRVKVDWVHMRYPSHLEAFIVRPDSSYPFYLLPNDTMTIAVRFTSDRPGPFYDTLMVNAEYALLTYKYVIKSLRVTSGVSELQSSELARSIQVESHDQSIFFISSSGTINSVSIYDLTGRRVETQTGRHSKLQVPILPSGSYVAVVSCETPDGLLAKAVKRFEVCH